VYINSLVAHLHNWGLGARLEGVSQATFAAVLAILVKGHEDTSATLGRGAFTTESFDFAIRIDLVIF